MVYTRAMEIHDPLENHFRLTTTQKAGLKRLKIETIHDLLYHFPSRYENLGNSKLVRDLQAGEQAILYGTLSGLKTKKTFRSRMSAAEGWLTDSTGKIKLQWFNQPYIAKMYQEGSTVRISGKVTGKESFYISNPEVTPIDTIPQDLHDSLFTAKDPSTSSGHETLLFPIYPESKGITGRWMYHALNKIFAEGLHENFDDPIPENILKKYNLPKIQTALIWIHTPKTEEDAEAARKRFAFAEVFFIQLGKQQERLTNTERKTLSVELKNDDIQKFVERFPFQLTTSQSEAILAVTSDLRRQFPMNRLLEGDVGSGKTVVAAATTYAAIMTTPPKEESGLPAGRREAGHLQVAYMCPTEILAKQQFESFIEYFEHLPINIGLITSSGCKKFPSKVNQAEATDISRSQLLKWVESGDIPILVGTHSLIQKTVQFENLAYVIIDEQHRFGTAQRQKLTRKPASPAGRDGVSPHLLSMTATPIPRTLALTIYGDLDLTLLDQMPAGRKPIITDIITPDKQEAMYAHVRSELEAGRQLYVICPRIDEPDPDKATALRVKSVTAEAKRLKENIFQDYEIDILHSKMTPKVKEEVMNLFAEGETNILVATSVVEVGVNVPNATMIIIEGAERFGLAQLHQLRGRVIRSNHQAYCYAVADTKAKTSVARLKALKTAKNGFELSEEDLKLRGSGELYGRRQWGISDLGMTAIQNIKMVEAARDEATKLIEKDPQLSKHSDLKERVLKKAEDLHFE